MFALHETTQRRVCRILFVVICVVPTLVTMGSIGYFYRPWRLADWQQTLTDQFHLRASVGDIARPLPTETVLNDVQLADLHTDQQLCQFERIEQKWDGSRLSLHANTLQIDVQHLPTLAQSLATWLSAGRFSPIQLTVDHVQFTGRDGLNEKWQNLALTTELQDQQLKNVRLQVETEEGNTPLRLLIQQAAGDAHAAIQARLMAQETAVSANLLEQLIPGGWHRSAEAEFRGLILFSWHRQQLSGSLQGAFSNINLAKWLGPANPHPLDATIHVQLDKFVWQNKGIQSAQGSLSSQGGTLAPSLLKSAQQLLLCSPSENLAQTLSQSNPDSIAYDALAVRFQLDQSGLTIQGQPESNSILSHQDLELLYQPQEKLPVSRLVRLFHLPVAGWLPDTTEAQDMANRLPLPSQRKLK